MKDIFKLGDHVMAGISFSKISLGKGIYMFMITLLLVHLSIAFNKKHFKIGLGVGDNEIYIKIQLGYSL